MLTHPLWKFLSPVELLFSAPAVLIIFITDSVLAAFTGILARAVLSPSPQTQKLTELDWFSFAKLNIKNNYQLSACLCSASGSMLHLLQWPLKMCEFVFIKFGHVTWIHLEVMHLCYRSLPRPLFASWPEQLISCPLAYDQLFHMNKQLRQFATTNR